MGRRKNGPPRRLSGAMKGSMDARPTESRKGKIEIDDLIDDEEVATDEPKARAR